MMKWTDYAGIKRCSATRNTKRKACGTAMLYDNTLLVIGTPGSTAQFNPATNIFVDAIKFDFSKCKGPG